MDKRKIYSYNGLRGLAAMGIFFSHMSFLAKSDSVFLKMAYRRFMCHGSVCTSYFYISAGFLAYYSWKECSFGQYIKKKLIRIYPLAMTVLVLAMALDMIFNGNEVINKGTPVGTGIWWFNVFVNVTMLKAFIPVEAVFYSFHGPSWYLSALFVFYILFWFLMQKITNKKSSQSKIRTVLLIWVAAYGIELIICIFVQVFDLWKESLFLTYVNPWFRIFGECFLGVFIGMTISVWTKVRKNHSIWEMTAVIFFAFMIFIRNFTQMSVIYAWIWAFPVVLLMVSFYGDAGCISKILSGRWFQVLGDISFEFYMLHAFVYEGIPVVSGIVSKTGRTWIEAHAGLRFVVTLVLSVLSAWFVHMFTEQMKGKRNKWKPQRSIG